MAIKYSELNHVIYYDYIHFLGNFPDLMLFLCFGFIFSIYFLLIPFPNLYLNYK